MLEGEKQIIKKARRGDNDSFSILYNYYNPQIYRFLLLKVNTKQEAEDLLHETFLRAWKNIENYNDRGFPFSSWLYRIARNLVIDHYRTSKINLAIDEIEENRVQIEPTSDNYLDIKEAFHKIKEALKQLSDEQQNLIIMRFIEEMETPEIALALGKSQGSVRVMQYRALQKLREILEEENGGQII